MTHEGNAGTGGSVDYRPEDLERIRKDFVGIRRKALFFLMGCAALLTIAVILYATTGRVVVDDSRIVLLFFGVWFVGQAFTFTRLWRCPACKKFLGLGLNPGSCPNCSAPLQ